MNYADSARVYSPAEDRLESLRKLAAPAAVLCFILAVVTAVICLRNNITIVFQNGFYLPILITALYYPHRGMVLAYASCVVYLGLYLLLGPETAPILPALVRVAFFLVVSAGAVYVSRRRIRAETDLHHHLEHLEERVAEQTRYISIKLDRSRQLEEAYRKGNEYYEQMFDQLDTPAIIWTPELYITDVNTSFCVYMNQDCTELIGRKITSILFFNPDEIRNYPVKIELPARPGHHVDKRTFWIITRITDPDTMKARAYVGIGMELPAIDTITI